MESEILFEEMGKKNSNHSNNLRDNIRVYKKLGFTKNIN